MSVIYVPILKWKKGEQNALKFLRDEQKELITPLIEIVDAISPSSIVENFNKSFEYPVFLDTFHVEKTEISILKRILDEFNTYERKVNPVLYSDNLRNNFKIISTYTDRVAIRIPVPEPIEGTSYITVINEIKRIKIDYPDIKIDLILDLGIVDEKSASISHHATRELLENHLLLEKFYDRIIIAVTSFPKDLQSVPSGGSKEFIRLDNSLFLKVLNNPELTSIKNLLLYSDYGVTKFSNTEIDFSKLGNAILPKARYTTPKTYWVLKGKKDTKTKVMVKNYKHLANEIYKSPKYYGEDFSYADKDIKERALGLNKKGQGGNKEWVTIAANHHVSVVIEELSNLYGI